LHRLSCYGVLRCSLTKVAKESLMKSKKLCSTFLGPLFVLAMTLPIVAQSAPQSNTTTTTTTTSTPDSTVAPAPATILQDSSAPDTNAPMTKGEMKDQRKQQKQEEKSADANAKAQKDHAKAQKNEAKATKDDANALKQEHKSTDAAEKADSTE
jgi:hypothetical protein